MRQSSIHSRLSFVLCAATLILTVMAGPTHAQGRAGCQEPERPSLGIAFGRSSPYLEFARGVVDEGMGGSVRISGGNQVTARGDVSIAGPLRFRVEGATTEWQVARRTYSPVPPYDVIADTPAGHITVRQITAAVGLQGGRASACGHVLVGGGMYWLNYRGAALRRPGVSLTAGIEVPTGSRGVVQVDVQLQLINTGSAHPVASSTVPAASLSIGWAFRF
jgi:hypothetical protein